MTGSRRDLHLAQKHRLTTSQSKRRIYPCKHSPQHVTKWMIKVEIVTCTQVLHTTDSLISATVLWRVHTGIYIYICIYILFLFKCLYNACMLMHMCMHMHMHAPLAHASTYACICIFISMAGYSMGIVWYQTHTQITGYNGKMQNMKKKKRNRHIC